MRARTMPYLFADRRLSDLLSGATDQAVKELAAWQPDDLLNTPEADAVDRLVRMATAEMPSLQRDNAHLAPPTEVKVDSVDLGPHFQVTVTRYTLMVPVTGYPPVFGMRASRSSGGVPQGEIDQWNSRLRLHCDNPPDSEQARAYFERTLDEIEKWLEWTRADIQRHNQQVARQLATAVAQRRAKLLKDRGILSTIGYPIMKRPDADNYAAPVKRRQIIPNRTARPSGCANPFVSEPGIEDDDYEAVLAVLRNARNQLERSPSMTAKLDEEETRDLLLVSLNTHFEGKAAGEVFNFTGKTDLLVRVGDRNIFIGECKIFDPKNKKSVEHVVTNALNQLLGYLAWRDTKAALLLFIRCANVSDVVEKAIAAISSHPNYKRPGKISSEERHDFVLHANGDTNREIHLAFLPFLIGSKNA
jgi:hypothetical protein